MARAPDPWTGFDRGGHTGPTTFPTRPECSFAACEYRSFGSPRSLRTGILIGNAERSFVAMLLRTDFLIGNLVNHNRDPSPVFFIIVSSKGFNDTLSLFFAT